MVKNDRNLGTYILLNIITCGIYSLVFLHYLVKDVETLCEGDGETTTSVLYLVLLSIATCGIYSYYWHYKLAKRIQMNGPRYGITLKEGGTEVLLWHTFGLLLCGLGPYIGMNIFIKNTNTLANAYNAYISQYM